MKFVRSVALDLPDEKELNRPELEKSAETMHASWERQLEKRKTLWPDGFVAGEFQVSAITNYNGWELPLRFSLSVYNPQYRHDDKLSRKYEGIIASVAEAAVPQSFLPPILSRVLVVDARRSYESATKKITSVHYQLKPGEEWLPQDSILISNQFQGVLQSPASDKERFLGKHSKVVLIRSGIVVCVLVPLALIIYLQIWRRRF